jgi:hypothetical protein
MSRHVTYKGTTIDMEALARENEKVPAMGNMRVNARGDEIKGGQVTKTADQIARENHRVQSVVVNSGLKGKQPVAPDVQPEQPKAKAKVAPAAPAPTPVVKETELPSGDIIVEGENGNT